MFDLNQCYNWRYKQPIVPPIHNKHVHSSVSMGDQSRIRSAWHCKGLKEHWVKYFEAIKYDRYFIVNFLY